MRNSLFFLISISMSFIVNAADWNSPIDKKYQKKNPALYESFDTARTLLDEWRGQRENIEKARHLLSEIIRIDNSYAPAHRELGRLYIAAGYISGDNHLPGALPPSEAAIKEAIRLEPNYADAYVLLGHLYTKMKRYEDASNALIIAEKIGTKSPWLHLNLADLMVSMGKRDVAYKHYMIVINEKTENAKAYGAAQEGIIDYFISIGDYDSASNWHEKKIAHEPQSAWSYGNYAEFLLFLKADVDGSILQAEKALSLMNYGMARFTLACALFTKWAKMKDADREGNSGREIFLKAQSLYPDLDMVIDKTSRYRTTRDTAIRLRNYRK